MTIEQPAWTGMVSVDDTALAVTDTGGTGTPVVYLNGSYASQKDWRRVVTDLGDGYRHITFDERARGKSKTATDYSFEACLRDLDAVLKARGVERPILVGWSYGALIAMHWAARNPDRVQAVVSVDGALPSEWLDDATQEQIRKLFRRLGPIFPICRPLGLAARMSAVQHAEINIELNQLCAPAALDPVCDQVTAPTRYVLATGGNLGAEAKVMEQLRANLDPVIARNPNIQISAKVPSNHSKILRNDFGAVANAVRETVSLG
ncbi:alpha/beta fold hydrolase [Kitasatospora kifunensis]|uniref:Pimeloyl-ACP methyl ester carboxylesterase n=1 Tax=Kitasatospora kifunensis TaxID=58351 RepID=A0A7W7VW26_KITKI|nr:alpha/beta hydrolase [Kitasatospora kifunensis]MBB4924493.1 pimeloyl-ACP methyl ester carboxylesterase [Kitasatospora kifunensis]